MNYARVSKEERDSIVAFAKEGHSLSETMRHFERGHDAVRRIFTKENIKVPRGGGKYEWNENFFDNIDTENKAYWLGFISADGYVIGNKIGITLKSTDKDHLQKFLNDVEGNHTVKIFKRQNDFGSSEACRVQVFSAHAVESLKKLGVGERKSHILRPCKKIPNELKHDYWRGLIDGDGWITGNKNTGQRSMGLCGSLRTVIGFKLFVKRYVTTSQKIFRMKSIFAFRLSGKKLSQKIIRVLYEHATVYLDRKKEKANSLIQLKIRSARSWGHLKLEDLLRLKSEHGNWRNVGKFLGVGTNIGQIVIKRGLMRDGHLKVTHCTKGHELTPENTTMRCGGRGRNPYRKCKICLKAYYKNRHKKIYIRKCDRI